MRRITLAFSLLILTSSASAFAAEPRTPIDPVDESAHRVVLTRFGAPSSLERARTPGKRAARFQAEPAPLPGHVVLLVEAHSVSEHGLLERFRCVAVDDVSECLGTPLSVRYLPRDRAVRLTVTPMSLETSEGLSLVRNAQGEALARTVSVARNGQSGYRAPSKH